MVTMVLLVSSPPARALDNYNPGPVLGIGATPQSGALAIYWSPPAFTGADLRGTPLPIVEYKVTLTRVGSNAAGTCRTTSTGCTISGLQNGMQYFVEITARNTYGYASWAGGGPFVPCCSLPAQPGGVTAAATDGAASVSWRPPANAAEAVGPFSYTVVSTVPGVGCTTSGTTCSFSGLTNGTTLSFFVSASTPYGTGPAGQSNAVTPVGLPGAPSDVRAFLTKGAAQVWWVAPANSGGAVIQRYVAVSGPGGLTCTAFGGLSCEVTGLSNGTTYTFTVTAFNVVGAGPSSAPSAPARLLAGPGAPAKAKARVVGRSAVISWLPPRSTGGLKTTKYVVTSSPGRRTCTSPRLTCTVTGLDLGTRYVFAVVAYNQKGAGAPRMTTPVWTAQPIRPPVPTPTPPTPTPDPKPEQPLS